MPVKKYSLEYIIRSSPTILFEFLTNPSNLAQWFSDYCDSSGDHYIFGWDGDYQRATILEWVDDEFVSYRWEHSPENQFFSFRVYKSEISNETVLEVTDFAEAREIKDQTFLWDNQVDKLKHVLGAA
jgi:uncharacterized protein YndB with AHSA1/START domain